ncbi:MAG: two-component system, OmpR family, sensor histidine kinase VicK [Parcubacteria group bacterium Gr01-1014_8]|nr:MAG: two-component system, OmpR family, sensor histidine kinase VicK [Parcubacteria group bacterium Gr01-1014_8]
MERAKTLWKRSVGLVIGFADKYRYEPFFRTEVNVLALQCSFGMLVLAIAAISLSFLYQDVVNVLSLGIVESATSNIAPSTIGANIVSELQYLQTRNVIIVITSVIGITMLFSYVIAYVTLGPVRNALNSQKQFIGNIAHELRTPLSTIKTNTEVALFDADMNRELRDIMTSNVEELDRISDIINNLLTLSNSVRPERIEFDNVDLGTIVENVTKKMRGLAERKHLEVTTRMSDWRIVWGNSAALEQIVTNILKNAITYSSLKGRVGITVEGTGPNTIELSIQDSGTGIARSDLFRIFEPFYRADRSRNRVSGGSGLGLTIVSELVKQHGGKISVRSAEGRGTSVTVLFPAGNEDKDQKGRSDRGSDEIAVDYSHRPNNLL